MDETTGVLSCGRHGNATPLSCVRCEAPICWGCLVETDVGFMCEKHGRRTRGTATLPSDRRQRRIIGLGAAVVVLFVVLAARRVSDGGASAPAPRPVVYRAVTDRPANAGFEDGPGPTGRPAGWNGGGEGFEVAVDTDLAHQGAASARLRRVDPAADPRGGASLTSCFPADGLRSAVVRMTAYLRSQDVSGRSSGLTMSVIGGRPGRPPGRLGGASMGGLPIRGTSEWRPYTLQVPVSEAAEQVCVGALLTGGGTLWVDDVTLEVGARPLP